MLKTRICGIKLENPTVLASGIMGVTGASLCFVSENGAGAVTTKSIGLEERKGHPAPVVLEWENGLINAVGLSSPGIEEGVEELKAAVEKSKSPVIASIFAPTTKQFGEVARQVSKAKPAMIEANISCPNVEAEFGKPFATDQKAAAGVTKIVKKNSKVPVIVKLSPNVPNIKIIAQAVEKAGADSICAVNTVGPGMVIDIKTGKPLLANKAGGLSGPAIRPVAVRCVYDIYESVKIPIIGTGGVTYGKDAVEMIMAGALAVGVGSAVHYRGIDVFRKVCNEIIEFMEKEGYSKLKDFRGIAHE
ncbi:dihydroorotate dehydrogenase [Candidatus Woesearchaeota archaeon]|nr:dihydroorotate dehydrogenase [Candidatus Woesearchaeota archaeon]